MTSICSIDGCDRIVYGLEFCQKHYTRLKRTGTTDDPVRVMYSDQLRGRRSSNNKNT